MHDQIALPEPGRVHYGQVNAHLSDEVIMRVGIPHRSGKLAFHAFDNAFPAMVSASAFWNREKQRFHIPEVSDLYEVDFALDSAGFTAMMGFAQKGPQAGMAGVFPWTYAQYLELAASVGCSWHSQPDMCCEPQIAGSREEVLYRVRATATLLEGTLRTLAAWQCEMSLSENANVISNTLKPPVPVLQGWEADDYLRSLDLMMSVWSRWEPWLAPPVLIGLGSVCRRDLHHPKHGLFAILRALEGRIPAGSRLHLFGVKSGPSLRHIAASPIIASCDSMAYDVSARIDAYRSGKSNTLGHRQQAMTAWMEKANHRLALQSETVPKNNHDVDWPRAA